MGEAYPISEMVSRAVETRLKGVRDAAGNPLNLIVERYDPFAGNVLANKKCVIVELADTPVDTTPTGRLTWDRDYQLDLCVRESEASAVTPDTRLNSWIAAIQDAIMSDPQWGGMALNSQLGGSARWDAEGDHYGATITFAVRFRTNETNSYSIS